MSEPEKGLARSEVRAEKSEPSRFARLSVAPSPAEGRWPVPPDGLCLSSLLLLSPREDRREVLVGKLDPAAPWGRIGGLDARRILLNSTGWMLPSCHLLYFEAPEAAARRILREQLGVESLSLEGPQVHSEVYTPRRHPQAARHWDIEFLFRGVLAQPTLEHSSWRELRFVDPSRTPRSAFTRSHDEVLELAGYRFS